MNKSDVISHFGSVKAAAKAIGITTNAMYMWPELVPRGSAYTVQVITAGKLKVDPSLYPPKKKRLESAQAEVA